LESIIVFWESSAYASPTYGLIFTFFDGSARLPICQVTFSQDSCYEWFSRYCLNFVTKKCEACQKTELSAWYTFNLLLPSTKLKEQSACISCLSVSSAMLMKLKFLIESCAGLGSLFTRDHCLGAWKIAFELIRHRDELL